jgi:hypothetical protein
MFCIGEGSKYKPLHDLRSMPEAGRSMEQVENHGRACTKVLFLYKAELRFFRILEIVTSWLVVRSQYSLAGTFTQKIPLAENRFLQAGKGAENTKEKSRQCLT